MIAATLEQPLKTRAQVLRDRVHIDLATNEDGSAIADVLKENGIVLEGADWSKVFPHWLVARFDGKVMGCCQVLVSKPVGYVEFMFVRPSAPFKMRAIAMRKLIVQSMSTLSHAGCNYVGGIIAQKNHKFTGVITKLNFVKSFPADLYVKRLK